MIAKLILALGCLISPVAKPKQSIFWDRPLSTVEKTIISSPLSVKNINVFNGTVNVDGGFTGFDLLNLLAGQFVRKDSIQGNSTVCGNSGIRQILKVAGGGHFIFDRFVSKSNIHPMDGSMCWRRTGVYYPRNCNNLPFVMHSSANKNATPVNVKIGPKLSTGRFAGFPKCPQKQECGNGSRDKRGDGHASIHAGQPIGFGHLFNRSPLRAEISGFILLRILAVGLIWFGWRLGQSSYASTRFSGGLIVVVGIALFSGIIEMIRDYS